VFDARSNFTAQVRIAEILQFDRDRHRSSNSIEEAVPVRGATRSRLRRTGLPARHEQAYAQRVLKTRTIQGRRPE